MKNALKIFLLIFLSLTTFITGCSPAVKTPLTTSPPYLSKLGTVEKDISYSFADLFNLKLDVYYPLTAPGPMPVVIYLHGGAWVGGDKSDASSSPEITELVNRGYLVASVNYGLAPRYSILEQIENAKCAIRFMRANISRFGIDPDRIGAFGASAGGHLAALIGTADKNAGLDGIGGFSDQSSRVKIVVDFYGPTDLKALFTGSPAIVLQELMGTSNPSSSAFDKINPLTYVSSEDPPFLILHGDKDSIVPVSQSQILYEKLIAAGVPVTFVVVKNGEHGFTPVGGVLSPTRVEITTTVVNYFDSHLK